MLTHCLALVERVVFRVGAGNLRSRRAMTKIGGRLVGLREDVVFPDGRRIAHVFYDVDRQLRRGARLAPEALHALKIARKHIDLEIDPVALRQRAQRGHLRRVRDDV